MCVLYTHSLTIWRSYLQGSLVSSFNFTHNSHAFFFRVLVPFRLSYLVRKVKALQAKSVPLNTSSGRVLDAACYTKFPYSEFFPTIIYFSRTVCELPSQPFMMSQRTRSLSQVNERSHTQLLVLPKDTERGPYIKMDRASSLTRGPTQKCPKPACRCRPAAKHGCKWLHPHNQIWNLPVSKWTMNLWASKGLFTNQRVTSLRLRPALYTVIFFWLVHLMYTEANSKFCCWRLKTKGLKGGEQYVIFQCNFIHSLLYTHRPCYAWQKWRLQRWWKHLQKWLFNCCSLTAGVFRHEGNSLPLHQQ